MGSGPSKSKEEKNGFSPIDGGNLPAPGAPPAYSGPTPASAPAGAPPAYAVAAPDQAQYQAPQFNEPPPAYSNNLSDGSTSTVQYTGCIEQQMYQQRYMAQQASMYPQGQRPPPGAVVHAQFDAGARFDRNAPPSLPPPPPGVAPTPAQLAAMGGGTVVMTQKKESFMSGTGGGGTTFW